MHQKKHPSPCQAIKEVSASAVVSSIFSPYYQ
ncbi:hypothetical protein VCHC50A1_3793, partial [Vibrio cholerae HC-50A1]